MFKSIFATSAMAATMAVPAVAFAGESSVDSINKYASQEQVTTITQFSDVRPTDWAYQALGNLVERYGCVAGYPNGTFGGGKSMSRYEAAALLNACLDRVTEVTDELRKLQAEFANELSVIRGRVDGLEAKVGVLESQQFSTTTKLKGVATFVMGANAYGGSDAAAVANAKSATGATTFNYDLKIDFDTSFTGKDLLRTRLRSGNFANTAYGNGSLSTLEVAFQEPMGEGIDSADVVAINRLYYQFPLNDSFTATVGAKVRQDDMLAMWPSVYPADSVLDLFTYAGAPGAYNLSLGSGAGISWQKNGFSVSANYVSVNADDGNPGQGGIGTSGSSQTGTVQVAYTKNGFGAAVAYSGAYNTSIPSGTPLTLSQSAIGNSQSVAVSGYWQPQQNGFIPSVSTGWGITNNSTSTTQMQSWYVGLQWADAFVKGNALGMAVGQPTFVTTSGSNGKGDGQYAWEAWYKFQVTDNIAVTPAVYYLSNPNGGQTTYGQTFNNFGGLIKTTFRF